MWMALAVTASSLGQAGERCASLAKDYRRSLHRALFQDERVERASANRRQPIAVVRVVSLGKVYRLHESRWQAGASTLELSDLFPNGAAFARRIELRESSGSDRRNQTVTDDKGPSYAYFSFTCRTADAYRDCPHRCRTRSRMR
jgi:hypothetical protein